MNYYWHGVNWYELYEYDIDFLSIPKVNIEQNIEPYMNWFNLPINPNAIRILEQNLDKINWDELSRNSNAIRILESTITNGTKNYFYIDDNKNPCFPYHFIKMRMNIISEELMMKVFHPDRLQRYIDMGLNVHDITDY